MYKLDTGKPIFEQFDAFGCLLVGALKVYPANPSFLHIEYQKKSHKHLDIEIGRWHSTIFFNSMKPGGCARVCYPVNEEYGTYFDLVVAGTFLQKELEANHERGARLTETCLKELFYTIVQALPSKACDSCGKTIWDGREVITQFTVEEMGKAPTHYASISCPSCHATAVHKQVRVGGQRG